MCTLGENLNLSERLHQHARIIFETNNFASTGNSLSAIENSEILEDSLLIGNSQIQENHENSEILCEDPRIILRDIKKKNLNRPIIGHININFLESKFEALKLLIEDILDVLVVTETKIDASYPTSQFEINGFGSPFRLDRNTHGGGVMIYVREHLTCKLIPFQNKPDDIECIFFELNLRKKKWLIMGGYNPAKESTSYFLDHVSKNLDKTLANYDHILILGDLNSTMSEVPMQNFCELYNLENLIKQPTCYKNPTNPSSIDVMLTNTENSFQNSKAIETGLSDHHKMIITVLKTYTKKKEPNIIRYRSYKNFDMSKYKNELKQNLEQLNKETMNYEEFHQIFMSVLGSHAPMKKKQ